MKFEDFSSTTVPEERRVEGFNIFLAWMGFILVVASMSFGGGLAGQMQADQLVKSILIGNTFLALCGAVAGYIGSASALSFGSLASKVFGRGGWRLAILYIPLTLIGWYAIESSIFGNFMADTFGLSDFARRAIMVGAAILFSVSAYVGVRFIGRVSYVLIPAVLLISLFALSRLGDGSQLSFGFSDTQLSQSAGTAIVMSTWIFSALLVVPDLTRFVRTPWVGAAIGAAGVFIGNSVALGIGALAAAYTKQSDPALILVGLGYTPLAVVLTFASIWSTNDNNMYSSSLNVARSLGQPRQRVVLILALLGAVIAAFNPANLQVMFGFLIFMGASAPPLGAVVLGSYIYRAVSGREPAGTIAPWIGWAGGTALAYLFPGAAAIPIAMGGGFLIWLAIETIETRISKPVREAT
ncbi:MAG: cytosine permease [Sphingomonadales bacterium]|jgi:cytosine permease|nr:cytosine permease [Sphingomonadales bacterium]